eukprot:TRINITY_DN3686_c0_g1_i3.p1 TRINITY_DN3686_c0_g1~~TRINITY_DN3686_c0_g1_i3.p1  ORF type:complete len:162 (+),score=44.82 TRINITY_DN3686_c0_g1_i3:183-668(+)
MGEVFSCDCARSEAALEKEKDIFRAVKKGDLIQANKILKNCPEAVSLTAEPDHGTPLHEAAIWGREGLIKVLIASKADVNALNDGESTPLHWAAYHGRRDAAKALLEAGADIDAKNKRGESALALARSYNRKAMAALLQARGAADTGAQEVPEPTEAAGSA